MNEVEKIISETLKEVNMMDKLESDIESFYKETLRRITNQEIDIAVEEISEGKYGVEVFFKDKVFWMISKAWDTVREITINIMEVINELQLA